MRFFNGIIAPVNTAFPLNQSRAYVSPEQIRGESISKAADIYSLGVVIAELLIKCHPNEEFRKAREKGASEALK